MKQARRRVKDDLVDGRETLRLDDLERLEMTAVQLDEARNLLDRGTVSHARLAFILLDNAAEVIMRRNAEVELDGNMSGAHTRPVGGDPGRRPRQRRSAPPPRRGAERDRAGTRPPGALAEFRRER